MALRRLQTTTWLWIFITAYIIIFGVISCLRHYNFQTQTWDMGAFAQTFWNTVHGRVMFNNLEEAKNHLGVHASPWLFVLVPGYAIFQSPYYLLIIQTIALGLGAWPLYLLARKILSSNRWALLIAGGYLLFPSLHWVNLFDFHEIAFFVPLLLAAFYFIQTKKWRWAILFLALSASTKEDAILAVAAVGLYLLIRRQVDQDGGNPKGGFWNFERKAGLVVLLAAAAYFLVSVKVIMPALGGGLLRLDRYADFGTSGGEIIYNVVSKPALVWQVVGKSQKFFYLLGLFLPMAFTPFLHVSGLILILPGLAENLLTSFEFQFTSLYQYDSILIPGVWLAAVFGLKEILKRWPGRERRVYAVLLILILVGFVFRSPISPRAFPPQLFRSYPAWEAYRKLVSLVPEKVSVAAQTNLVPHLSHREHAYMLGREPFAVDVVVVDGTDYFGFPDLASLQKYVDSYLKTGQYEIKTLEGRYALIVKKGVKLKVN